MNHATSKHPRRGAPSSSSTAGHHRKPIVIKAPARLSSDINVTPLVDVVLVLLIIFMVVTPLLEKDINVRVPSTEKVDQVAEVPQDQLVVRVDAKGDLRLNDTLLTKSEYVEVLRKKLNPRPPSDRVVFVVPDDDANYGVVTSALDGAKAAGAQTLGMSTEDPEPITKQ
jgi:biopolymer transport protein ExbD